ncbi:MAG: T9SS type A sorting domain-containing protein [Bacteroidia bacterium]
MSILIFLGLSVMGSAQYDPAGGLQGSLAINRNDNSIVRWADAAMVYRGWQNIADTSLGKVNTGDTRHAVGAADNYSISLGDGGSIILFFDEPIQNRKGFDFVVFENGFQWQGGYFLELAFVEVSSNGLDFVRFPAFSNADTNVQIENLAAMNPEWYKNLAGKHQAPYGTPFDLEELKDSTKIDLSAIYYMRLVDVVGNLDSNWARRDAQNHKINDPWPTAFESGGFDLDAVGVLGDPTTTIFEFSKNENFFYPNPAKSGSSITTNVGFEKAEIITLAGEVILEIEGGNSIDLQNISAGIYLLRMEKYGKTTIQKLCID